MFNIRPLFFGLILFISGSTLAGKAQISDEFRKQVETYKERYGVEGPLEKIVDNQGNGFEALYGTRNVRTVLHGVLYRGGANNVFHHQNPRDNKNPLPNDGLENLCQEGFSYANYLYSTRYDSAPTSVSCGKGKNTLVYDNIHYGSEEGIQSLLNTVHRTLQSGGGPIYVHCWNGWHASGMFAAIALRQFCDYTPDQAIEYWDLGTDGNNRSAAYDRIRKRVRDFQPANSLKLTPELQALVCPKWNRNSQQTPLQWAVPPEIE